MEKEISQETLTELIKVRESLITQLKAIESILTFNGVQLENLTQTIQKTTSVSRQKYHKDMSWKAKIVLTLKEHKDQRMTVKDILAYLIQIDSEIKKDEDKSKQRITYEASILLTQKGIKAEKIGKTNFYYI